MLEAQDCRVAGQIVRLLVIQLAQRHVVRERHQVSAVHADRAVAGLGLFSVALDPGGRVKLLAAAQAGVLRYAERIWWGLRRAAAPWTGVINNIPAALGGLFAALADQAGDRGRGRGAAMAAARVAPQLALLVGDLGAFLALGGDGSITAVRAVAVVKLVFDFIPVCDATAVLADFLCLVSHHSPLSI